MLTENISTGGIDLKGKMSLLNALRVMMSLQHRATLSRESECYLHPGRL